MKPTACTWKDKAGNKHVLPAEQTCHNNWPITPLYSIHEVADFIRGMYFDEIELSIIKVGPVITDEPFFAQIADLLEKEEIG